MQKQHTSIDNGDTPKRNIKTILQGWDRFLTRSPHAGQMGIFSYGHVNINPYNDDTLNIDPNIPWMDEHAVRIRAGLLHLLSWTSIINLTYLREPTIAFSVMITAMFEFVTSTIFGMTPVAPLGTIATLIAMVLHPQPLWVPARPKRFAWSLGFLIVVVCFVCWRVGWENGFKQKHAEMEHMGNMMRRMKSIDSGDNYKRGLMMMNMTMDDDTNDCMMMDMNDLSEYPIAAAMIIVMKVMVSLCLILTWLEASCGFCVGCWIYNKFGDWYSTNRGDKNGDKRKGISGAIDFAEQEGCETCKISAVKANNERQDQVVP